MMKGIDTLQKKNKPLLGGHRYLTDGELSDLLHINRHTLQEYRENPFYQTGWESSLQRRRRKTIVEELPSSV